MSEPTGSRASSTPRQPLPGPPEPWHWAERPVDRGGPPWFMTEMIAAEPAFAERLPDPLGADGPGRRRGPAGRGAPRRGRVGASRSRSWAAARASTARSASPRSCATRGTRAGLPDGQGPVAVQAFEASLAPARGGLCIAVSHDGATWATTRALDAARAAGARTAIVTVSGRAPGAQGVDIVLETVERDQSYCHTIGYTSPLLAATAIGAALTGEPVDPAAVRALLAAGIDDGATRRGRVDRGGSGRAAGRSSWSPPARIGRPPASSSSSSRRGPGSRPRRATSRRSSTATCRRRTRDRPGPDPDRASGTGERVARARQALEAAGVIGIRTAAILSADVSRQLDPSLTPLGRIVVPEAPALPAPVAVAPRDRDAAPAPGRAAGPGRRHATPTRSAGPTRPTPRRPPGPRAEATRTGA